MAEATNLYAPPQAAPAYPDDETYQPKILSFSGRIGRLRYLAYYSAAMLAFGAVMGLAGGAAALIEGEASGSFGALGGLVLLMGYVAVIVAGFTFAKRRLNDLDQSGWLSLLFIVPLVGMLFGLYVLFWPGTEGPNKYGPAPSRNGTGVIVASLILPAVFAIGIMAAIAVPAYQDYVTAANAAQASQ